MKTYNTYNQKGHDPVNSKGFTLVETIVAIFILLLTITTMISLSTGSFYNVRYAQNQITANMLVQETLEYIRHTRDNAIQQNNVDGFENWLNKVQSCEISGGSYCDINQFSLSPENISFVGEVRPSDDCIQESKKCGAPVARSREPFPLWRYPNGQFGSSPNDFTGTDSGGVPVRSPFSRGVQFRIHSPEQVEAIVFINWKNGSVSKQLKESIILTNW
jgi:type II secretory pathway pseudopilin PulG